jgi:hypothetical protein
MSHGRFPTRIARSLPQLCKEAFQVARTRNARISLQAFSEISLVAPLLFLLLSTRRTRGVIYNFTQTGILKMPELIRSIAARFREYLGNRRRAPRYKVRLSVRVSPVRSAKPARVSLTEQDALYGYTRDISISGLALILPAIRINSIYLMGENRTLEILIEHESEPIVIYAVPTRYEKLEEEDADKGYLIGVKLTDMTAEDRTRFNALLK